MNKIYLKLKKKPKSIKELLLNLFSNGTDIRRTNVITYSDKDCLSIQCNSGKLRSFDEIYEIIITYFPKANLKDIIHNLITLDFKLNEPLYIKMTNCSTINKIVLYYSNEHFNTSIFGINKYNSKYSWDELLGLLSIKSVIDIKNYVKKYIKTKESMADKVINISTLSKYSNNFKLPYSNNTESKIERYLNACYVLNKVAEVYNEGTILNWNNTSQLKYLPYKYFSVDGGSGVDPGIYWYVSLDAPGCLYYKSSILSEASYNNFKEYWEDYWGVK